MTIGGIQQRSQEQVWFVGFFFSVFSERMRFIENFFELYDPAKRDISYSSNLKLERSWSNGKEE
jgi:hypothetical protein